MSANLNLQNHTISPPPLPSPPLDEKKSYTTEQAAEQIDRHKMRWPDRNGDGKIHFSLEFYSPSKPNRHAPKSGSEFTNAQKQVARKTVEAWTEVANISFTEQSTDSPNTEGKLILGNTDDSGSRVAYASYPGNGSSWFLKSEAEKQHKLGSYSRFVLAHEIGHNLGLPHPGNYNDGNYDKNAAYKEDTQAHSIMSYWGEREAGYNFKKNSENMPCVPLMHDIATMQKIYGPNFNTRSTDTTYGFNSNTGHDFLSLNSDDDEPIFCVWDGGGVDTLDFSGFHHNQTINLNAESFSNVGGMEGNVSIAKGVILENSIGGSGNDILIGNNACNRLKGGVGADSLTGGGGSDTFVYDSASESPPSVQTLFKISPAAWTKLIYPEY